MTIIMVLPLAQKKFTLDKIKIKYNYKSNGFFWGNLRIGRRSPRNISSLYRPISNKNSLIALLLNRPSKTGPVAKERTSSEEIFQLGVVIVGFSDEFSRKDGMGITSLSCKHSFSPEF